METRLLIADLDLDHLTDGPVDDPEYQDPITAAVDELRAGNPVALPTETVYGLAADALNPDAVAKVFEAKERPAFDPLICHLGKTADLDRICQIPDDIRPIVDSLTEAFWPGPLTLVLPKKDIVPDLVTSGLDTVAVRLSAHPVMRGVAKALGNPLAAPSANRFGRISPTAAPHVLEELDGRIPLIIDGGACNAGLESTIISIAMGEKRPEFTLLRPGPVTKEELQKFGKVVKPRKTKAEHLAAKAAHQESTNSSQDSSSNETHQRTTKGSASDKPTPQRTTKGSASPMPSPGQLLSHYAPSTPLFLYDSPDDFHPEEGKRYGLLSYCQNPRAGYLNKCDWAHIETLSPGNSKLAEAAVRFFFTLRKMDSLELDAIIAEPISEVGLGVAMMDRLRRAAHGSQNLA